MDVPTRILMIIDKETSKVCHKNNNIIKTKIFSPLSEITSVFNCFNQMSLILSTPVAE